MTLMEFSVAALEIVNDKDCHVSVEAVMDRYSGHQEPEIRYRVYRQGLGHTKAHLTPENALAEFRAMCNVGGPTVDMEIGGKS